jgi:PAS domain S-box-containing protein
MAFVRSDWPKAVMMIAGCAVAGLGTAVLVAWHVHFIPMIQAIPGRTPTHRMTALALLLSGGGLAFTAAGRKRAAALCAALVLLIATLVLAEYATTINFGIDELVGRDYLNLLTSHRGRMSPVSALCFLGFGVALTLTSRRRPDPRASTIVGVLSSSLAAVGMVSVLGQLLGYVEAYGWSQLTRMSPITSASVAILGAGLMAWAWHEGQEGQATPRWLPLGLGLGLAVGALGTWQGLMAHQQSELTVISHAILAGGLVGAALVAIAVAQAQQAWKRSRELAASGVMLHQLFEAAADGVILINGQGNILRVNRRAQEMFGYAHDEIPGTPIENLVLVELPDLRRPHRDHHRNMRGTRLMEQPRELMARRKNGSEFPVEISLTPLQSPQEGPVVVAGVRDITERKQAQEALRQSEERFRGVFEQGPIGVALLNADHRMAKTNPAFRRMLGYSEADLAKMTPLDMTYPADRESCGKLLLKLDTGEIPVCRMEKRYVKKDGALMWASLTASVVRDREGKPLYGLGMVEDITERKQAERKIAEQAALLELVPDSISVRDLQGRLIFWNRGSKDTYGWSAEEAIGRVPQELLHSKYPRPLKEIEAIVLAQGAWEGELEQLTREGKPIVVASRWSLWRDDRGAPKAILVINRDITAPKRAEEQLRNLTERLSLATRSASIGIWDWDLRSNTTVWDDTHFAIFGIPKVVPMPFEEFVRRVHPEDLPKVQASLQRAIQGRTQAFAEFRILRPDGSVRHIFSAEGVVLDEHDKVVRLVGTAMDITERKRMEAQIEANKAQLITSARLSALGMMAGNIAHEINNPVGIIHAVASNLIDMAEHDKKVPLETMARSARGIRDTSERIAGIVRSLLQISREGSSDRLFPTQISKILNGTLEICRERFRANGVKLILPAQVPDLSVSCREVRIAQVLLNLLQNAFDAVVDQKEDRWVRLEVTTYDDSVALSVIDSGPGIPAELQPRIMEPFFTTKPVGKGTGLGLSLSKTIAEEHGGRLEFGRDHGRTRFSLILPVVQEADRSSLIQANVA